MTDENGYRDVPASASDNYATPTKELLVGHWGQYQPYAGDLTMSADCTYSSQSGGSGTWRIRGDWVTFKGTLEGFCAGHARFILRYGTQSELHFYCDTPEGYRSWAVFVRD